MERILKDLKENFLAPITKTEEIVVNKTQKDIEVVKDFFSELKTKTEEVLEENKSLKRMCSFLEEENKGLQEKNLFLEATEQGFKKQKMLLYEEQQLASQELKSFSREMEETLKAFRSNEKESPESKIFYSQKDPVRSEAQDLECESDDLVYCNHYNMSLKSKSLTCTKCHQSIAIHVVVS
ncbi:unnamed protein product [Rhizophagus irregularis]|uniref:Uncharacterized protein n=1 Tax=Rhizophagus irregularis TaxID=588596 RepID=A0A2I1H2U4_9GLOM|nr:hypothetical protein RhiirA4_471214 [Rhizophagus irregularis]CAB4438258.1 unnamed protein product [Rhizophagus irregularis]